MTTSIVELRQYTLHPGQRDALIALFEREFIETQEACGLQVLGTFTDLDRPDRFVWWRGFESLSARAPALAAFYGGPVWAAHRGEANATMVDSDDVLLLQPVPDTQPRQRHAAAPPGRVFACVVQAVDPAAGPSVANAMQQQLMPLPGPCGGERIGSFLTHPGPNDFPRLPVRSDLFAFVWLAAFADEAAARAATARWPAAAQRLHLQPTARSPWR